jgi:hypothetical protein
MLRCTGRDNLILGLVCQMAVRAELLVRALVGARLPETPPQPLVLRTTRGKPKKPIHSESSPT